MLSGKYHSEGTYKGRRVVVDLAALPGGKLEVMAMYKSSGQEIDVWTGEDLDKAETAFYLMEEKYTKQPPKLTGKYAKLRDDLKEALQAGRLAEDENPEDGGTCNFDAPALELPRWRESLVEQAAKEAGSGCFSWSLWGSKRFVFRPDSRAQGNARTRNAEAMYKKLLEFGYNAMMYYQAD